MTTLVPNDMNGNYLDNLARRIILRVWEAENQPIYSESHMQIFPVLSFCFELTTLVDTLHALRQQGCSKNVPTYTRPSQSVTL